MQEVTSATRAPTEAEINETSITQDAASVHADSIQSRSSKLARAAYGQTDKATHKAVMALAMNLCGEQIRAVLTDNVAEPQKDAYVWRRDVLLPLVKSGAMIWRDSADKVAEIAKASGKERNALAIAYCNAKGGKLVPALASLKTFAFRLADYMRTNQSATILTAARANDVDSALAIFERKVEEICGDSFAKVSSFLQAWSDLAKGETRKAKADKAKGEGEGAAKGEGQSGETADKGAAETVSAPVMTAADVLAYIASVENVNDLATLAAAIVARKGEIDAKAEPAPVLEIVDYTELANAA